MCGLGKALRRSQAANAGLTEARGDYLVLLDEDDWFLPNHVAALVAALEQHPEAPVAYTGVWVVTTDQVATDTINAPYSAGALRSGNYIPVHAALFRRAAVDRGLRFDEDLDEYEDWDFWLQLSRRGSVCPCRSGERLLPVGGRVGRRSWRRTPSDRGRAGSASTPSGGSSGRPPS